ncbi:glycosyltransferase [Corynebacterium suedekumii]|nr:glycosyltransferase [Corynebacterium suedekumii]
MTVLLPALNAETTIRTAVTSTLRGMPRDAELFVLDDGSTDDTAEKRLGGRNTTRRRRSPPDSGVPTTVRWAGEVPSTPCWRRRIPPSSPEWMLTTSVCRGVFAQASGPRGRD